MAFPKASEESALHERLLSSDPLASADAFSMFTDALAAAVRRDVRCSLDTAVDSAVDALMEYLNGPTSYDPSRGRLSTFLAQIAKRRAIDRLRARSAEVRREQEFGALVELTALAPNEEMERAAQSEQLWEMIEHTVLDDRDRAALLLILSGERSTAVLAEAFGIDARSPLERESAVKRHRDRLIKALQRLGARLSNDD